MPAQPPARAGQADIVIVGGGPVGLMLACERRLSGTDPIVLERLPGIDETPKGNGLAGQIVPMLDYRGLLDRLRQEATFAGPVPRFSFGPLELDFSRLGTSPVHILTVPQRRLEEVLEARLAVLDKNAAAGVFIVYTSEDDPTADLSAAMTLEELRASARRVLGGDLPMTDPQRLSRLVGNSRQAGRYQAGRILLAGDAAHVFAVSLNTGLLDAVNLGWKLAAQVQGRAPDGVLESYHAERHLAGQHAILQARAQKALTTIGQGGTDELAKVSPEGAEALRELFGDVLQHPGPLQHIRELLRQPGQLRHIGELIEGSDVRYSMPASDAQPHPLVGKLAPDLQLETRHGRTRVAEFMHAAQGVLLDLTAGSAVAEAAPDQAGLITVITAHCLTGPAPAAALLIRPDGRVAWAAGPGTPDPAAGMNTALRTWFSPRTPPQTPH